MSTLNRTMKRYRLQTYQSGAQTLLSLETIEKGFFVRMGQDVLESSFDFECTDEDFERLIALIPTHKLIFDTIENMIKAEPKQS